MGVGCTCPSGFAGARDQENNAICRKLAPVVVAPPPVVVAPPPQISHPPTTKLTVTITDRFRPGVAVPPAALKPEVDLDSVLAIASPATPVRAEQEKVVEDLIQNTPDSEVDQKSDLYFRLGELYAQQQRYWRIKAAELATKSSGDAQAAANKAKDYLLKAVRTYKSLTDNDAFRNYPKMDTALFYYAYTLQGGKYLKEARAVYDKLLKNYPNSKYVPDAQLAFAEFYFDSNQLTDAEARYQMVLKFPKAAGFPYAHYKLGLIGSMTRRPKDAIDAFAHAMDLTRGNKSQVPLYVASRRGLVRAFADTGTPETALTAFKKIEAAAAFELVDMLAELYVLQGRHDQAAALFRALTSQPQDYCGWLSGFARESLLANPTQKSTTVDVCQTHVDAFKEWARTTGVDVK